ncbi:MAG: hypothetical protein ACXWCZ_06475 [Flavisolibacter sp.]
MKYIFSFTFILLIQNAIAQQPFQGTIVYSLKASSEKKEAELTAMFGVNKIKIKMKEKDEYDKKYVIIDLDSGKVFNIDTEEKDYKVTKLSTEITESPSPKVIAGYNTFPVQSNSSGPFGLIRQLMGGSITLYTSNDLIFPIDPKYSSNSDLIIVNNNKIVLGATIHVKSPFMTEDEDSDTAKKMVITAEAIRIDKTPIPKEEFLIPQDYVKRKKFDFNLSDSISMNVDTTLMLDTTVMSESDVIIDSVAAPTIKPTTKPKTKPTPSKKPVTKKGEATQRKKS